MAAKSTGLTAAQKSALIAAASAKRTKQGGTGTSDGFTLKGKHYSGWRDLAAQDLAAFIACGSNLGSITPTMGGKALKGDALLRSRRSYSATWTKTAAKLAAGK